MFKYTKHILYFNFYLIDNFVKKYKENIFQKYKCDKKSPRFFRKILIEKQTNAYFLRISLSQNESVDTLNDYSRKNVMVQRLENVARWCHFRRRCNSLRAGNFRSQCWIRKCSAATSVFVLLLLHTSAFPTRRATKPTYVGIYISSNKKA